MSNPQDAVAAAFYLDVRFWSLLTSLLAIALSQLPPVWRWFRRARLEVDVFRQINLSHKLGSPNAQLHLIMTNTGGREVRVKTIALNFNRGDERVCVLNGGGFFPDWHDKDAVLLAPFRVKPKEEWSHNVNFFPQYSRSHEKRCKTVDAAIRDDVQRKRAQLPKGSDEVVEADERTVVGARELFNENFFWQPGEYQVTVCVCTDPPHACPDNRLRMTIFESDTRELEEIVEQYKYGARIYWGGNPGIFVELVTRE